MTTPRGLQRGGFMDHHEMTQDRYSLFTDSALSRSPTAAPATASGLHHSLPRTAVGGLHRCREREFLAAGGRCNLCLEEIWLSAGGETHLGSFEGRPSLTGWRNGRRRGSVAARKAVCGNERRRRMLAVFMEAIEQAQAMDRSGVRERAAKKSDADRTTGDVSRFSIPPV